MACGAAIPSDLHQRPMPKRHRAFQWVCINVFGKCDSIDQNQRNLYGYAPIFWILKYTFLGVYFTLAACRRLHRHILEVQPIKGK